MSEYEDHIHKWYLFKEQVVFEPFPEAEIEDLFIRVEYGILSCNCASVKKVRIKKDV